MIVRSLATSTVSSSPKLLAISLVLLRFLAHSKTRFLNPDHNLFLKYILNNVLYKQFCAGENAEEVEKTLAGVKKIGFTGAILAYAKEAPNEDTDDPEMSLDPREKAERDISTWLENSLETVQLSTPGDFVALKFTGAGSLAKDQLRQGLLPDPFLAESIDRVCQLAHDRGVRVLIDGEQDELQDTIDKWTLELAKRHNVVPGKAIIFGTYQAYKKNMTQVLASHLNQARDEGFTLGVKLVRGAYLHSDPPERLHDSKADTDACYDDTAASVLSREWNPMLSGSGEYPDVSIMFATHNATSVRKAYSIYAAGRARSELLFAQLQGMADEISCELVEMNSHRSPEKPATPDDAYLAVYKYMAWGSTGECMKYLLRRAEENKDAVTRTREDRDALWTELLRRAKGLFRKT
ncbi:hypothetical protein LLEC1_07047 [Akanthomyces lecanii]|uniref:Proline dehydrogenase n=1 Tax=Cordyceps confragosa TaxID=2714763 RepID=A0A179IPV5_CORDF|nr:hypothetical protein LLEC1_07047 [Akanthomyces lecanii]